MGGVLSATMSNIQVQCASSELTLFDPPPGQTCVQYAGSYVQSINHGYLSNPSATSSCGYCQYANGTEYLRTINVSPDERWRDFGIFLAFNVSNWALVYFMIYTVRVRKWTFGIGWLFGMADRALDVDSGLFKREKRKFEAGAAA